MRNRNLLFYRPASDLAHLQSVKEKIDTKRNSALLGGGQNRIDAQHKKVPIASQIFSIHFPAIYN